MVLATLAAMLQGKPRSFSTMVRGAEAGSVVRLKVIVLASRVRRLSGMIQTDHSAGQTRVSCRMDESGHRDLVNQPAYDPMRLCSVVGFVAAAGERSLDHLHIIL